MPSFTFKRKFCIIFIIPEQLAIEPSGNASNHLNLYPDTISGYGNRIFYKNDLFSSSKSKFSKLKDFNHKPKRKKFEKFYFRKREQPLNYLMHDPGPYRKSLVCSTRTKCITFNKDDKRRNRR
jgi:hypothetical protein